MAAVKKVRDLVDMPKSIIQGSLDQLLSTIRMKAANRTGGSVVVLISPEGGSL